eukprot:s2324_g2.t1
MSFATASDVQWFTCPCCLGPIISRNLQIHVRWCEKHPRVLARRPEAVGVRCFSGESEDHREYKRWKLWLLNKFQTLDKLPKEARGAYLFTCLSGKALETVEHVDPSTYQREGGDTILLKLLDARFPERDETDELAEVLNEVFNLRAKEGESLRNWISRATELFDRCERKSGVKFPEEARGFMLLKWSGLNEEQQAVVKGRSLGILKREEISKAMRSCYPDFVVNRRKAVALVQEDTTLSPQSDAEVTGFDDIELFLADHDVGQHDDDALEFPENEVAEVLATSWKERRAEIAKLQKNRRFDQAKDLRRSFRVEIEEMKKKTKCNRCGRVGHWARECRQRRDPQAPSSGQNASRPSSKETAAGYVADDSSSSMPPINFVASVSPQLTLLQQLRQKREQGDSVMDGIVAQPSTEVFLVSSPGFVVLDSGCGKTIVGERTLQQFQQRWNQDGRFFPEFRNETNVFKYGNGERETSHRTVIMPIGLAGRYGTVQAAIVKGEAPLLLSRPALKRLGAVLDFHNDQICLFSGAATIDLVSNAAGQYVLNVMDFPENVCKNEVEKMGFKGLSLDTSTGWDLDDPKQQAWVEAELDQFPPDLLVICPPCTNAGGWFHLNSLRMPVHEVLKRKLLLKRQKAFCKKLIKKQLATGGRVLFEHPSPSSVWDDQDFIDWCMQYHSFVTHMCCFDLHVPATDKHPKMLIRKSTRLLCSHADMCVLRRNCPGDRDPDHVCHRQVAGSEPGIGKVSTHAGRYTPEFVSAVLNTVPKFQSPMEVLICSEDSCALPDSSVFEALAVVEATDPEKLKGILHKLHKNLGHPSNNDLVRILKHGQASDEAINLARTLTCPFCESRQPPAPANPGKTSSVSEFNQRIGLDVKHLPGWKVNQKIPALNIIDHATSFQLVVPFFETETSAVLRKLYLERWVQWAGPPKEVIMDPARTNLGEAMVSPTEIEGTQVHFTAAGAHWQLGKTEVHGGWFARVLSKVIDERSPATKEEWLECVIQSHVKNQMIQNYGFTPSQRVFGKNPEVPGDLLNEPVNVVAGTASIHDEAIARAQAVRTSARKAVLALQDDKVLRRALLARPRRDRPFVSGDVVAYWRDQKWAKGVLSQGGQWYGSGVVIGLIGRNVIIAHRRSIIRCAPEQVRPATSEEKALIETPGTELLGIKDMIQNGTFRSSQYIDLLSQSYPPQEAEVVSGPSGQQALSQNSDANDSVPSVPTEVKQKPESPSGDRMSVEVSDSSQGIFDDVPDKSAEPALSQSSVVIPPGDSPPAKDPEAASSYGPVRRTRVPSKSGPLTMLRPAAMKHDDFVEVMREVVPKLLEEATQPEASASESSHKRSADASADVPASKAAKTDESALLVEHAIAYVAAAECGNQESRELWDTFKNTSDNAVEVFINQYFSKRAQKEIPASRNEPMLQGRVDQAKVSEWQTLIDKGAVRVVPASESRWIRKHKANRIMGSRFVIVKKPEEEIVENGGIPDPANIDHWRVKARWCLQGHLDPDLSDKARSGQLQSPTLSQMGRTVMFQLMASHQWLLQLGDVKGAFLEAGPIPECYRPLFANLPTMPRQLGIRAGTLLVLQPLILMLDKNLFGPLQCGDHSSCLVLLVLIVGFTTSDLDAGQESVWTPAVWRSFKLSRAVGSTLAAEAQAMVAATGTLEWTALILAEAIDGIDDIRDYVQHLKTRPPVVVTDCKSLFDHLVSVSSPTSVEDRRTSIDIVILRQSISRLCASVRWVPTNRMLADSLTQSAGDPTDLLRACIRNARYQISPEETERVLLNELLSRASVHVEGTEPSTPGSFSVIESMDGYGAMSDASKRRSDDQCGDLSKRMYAPSAELESEGEPMCKPVGKTPNGQPIFLPSGVNSVEEWGRSVIQFGKFIPKKGINGISYEELFMSREEEKLSYVDWVIKQVRGAKGLLLDLSLYLCVRKAQTADDGSQLPVIPGTNMARILK